MSNDNVKTSELAVKDFVSSIRANYPDYLLNNANNDNYVVGYLTGFLNVLADENPEVMERIVGHADMIKLQIESKRKDELDARFAS